jgi:capsular polysaccharide biosynthesis protein
MELRQYVTIARRWWYLLLLPPLIVAAYGLATYQPPATVYSAGVRYAVGQPAGLANTAGYDPNYYRWLTSEYIATALKDWVTTSDFADAVSAQLAATGVEVPAATLRGALGADNARSILVVYLTWGSAEQVPAVFAAITAALQDNASAFPQLGGLAAEAVPLDAAQPGAVGASLRSRLDLPLKVAVALAAGVALALLAHYFDPFVRDRRDLEQLGLPVLGDVPRRRL